jgi:hypothetical protein
MIIEDRGDSDESAGSLDEKYSERWRNQQDLTLHDTRKGNYFLIIVYYYYYYVYYEY